MGTRRLISLVAATIVLTGSIGMASVAAETAASPAPALKWTACSTPELADFQCASYDVPRDWSDPSAGTFSLAVVRHKSTGKAGERIGSLFFNPGGPGGSGVANMPMLWAMTPASVKQRFDIVTWDPRGIGSSTPAVECEVPEWQFPPATGEVDWEEISDVVRTATAIANADCLERYADVAPYVGTNSVVRDLDALRAAVGDRQLNYWGASYGTRIGYVYALTYPDRFRAILLDGPVSPRSSTEDFTFGYSTAADPAIGMLFESYPDTKQQYARVMAALEEAPLRLSPTREITRWYVGYGLEGNAGSQASMPIVAMWLGKIDRAIFGSDKEKRVAKRFLRGLPAPVPTTMAGLPSFVQCLDYADRLSDAEQDAMGNQIRANAPITGWYRAQQIPGACEGLDALEPDPVPLAQGNNWTARMLILGATRDSQTPYKWTTSMANAFRSSVVVSYVGNQHVTYSTTPSRCVNNAASNYLLRLALPALDIACDHVTDD